MWVCVRVCVCVCAGPARFLDLLRLLHNQIMSTLVKICRTEMMGLEALPLPVSAQHYYANTHTSAFSLCDDRIKSGWSENAVKPISSLSCVC